MEQAQVSGVAKDINLARIALVGIKDEPGIAFKIFRILANEKINVDIIIQSIGRDGAQDISFTVSKNDVETAAEALRQYQNVLGYTSLSVDTHVAKVSVVGAGMLMTSGLAVMMFDALASKKINP